MGQYHLKLSFSWCTYGSYKIAEDLIIDLLAAKTFENNEISGRMSSKNPLLANMTETQLLYQQLYKECT